MSLALHRVVLRVTYISPGLKDFTEAWLVADNEEEATKILVAAKETPRMLTVRERRTLPTLRMFCQVLVPLSTPEGDVRVFDFSNPAERQHVFNTEPELVWAVEDMQGTPVLSPGYKATTSQFVIATRRRSAHVKDLTFLFRA